MLCQTIRCGCWSLFPLKTVLFSNSRLFESPTFESTSLFTDVTTIVACCVRVSRHLSCRLSGKNTLLGKKEVLTSILCEYTSLFSYSLDSQGSETEEG